MVATALCRAGLAEPAVVAQLQERSQATGQSVAELAVAARCATPATLAEAVAAYLGYEWLAEPPACLPDEVVQLLPADLGRKHGVVPWRQEAGRVAVLAQNPCDPELSERLAFAVGQAVRVVVAEPARVAALVRLHYGVPAADVPASRPAVAPEMPAWSPQELAAMAERRTVVALVDRLLTQAVAARASDIHFEPFVDHLQVRHRVDGTLRELDTLDRELALPVTSRLKVLADLDIAERRWPQDGRIHYTCAGRVIDLRVSTLPTQFGESVVLRVLDQTAVQLEIEQLGLPGDVQAGLLERLQRPNGILIVTGPTGSGKTTTLYAGLRRLNTGESKILTVEDPVEYEIEGLMQVPVNPAAGLTFAGALRSFLRQDPDVLMVGEIRDGETAQIAVQAALTGHLVLTTLHTNDAFGALTRLVDLGVEPFLLGASLEGVLAQRLVRRLCPHCRERQTAAPALIRSLGFVPAGTGAEIFFQSRGCPRCQGTGFSGRVGIFEWLPVTEALRDAIGSGAPLSIVRQAAQQAPRRTLRDEAWRLVEAGETSLAEIARHV